MCHGPLGHDSGSFAVRQPQFALQEAVLHFPTTEEAGAASGLSFSSVVGCAPPYPRLPGHMPNVGLLQFEGGDTVARVERMRAAVQVLLTNIRLSTMLPHPSWLGKIGPNPDPTSSSPTMQCHGGLHQQRAAA